MSLHDLVTVNAHYTRSINLERDSGSVDVVTAYIPTSRALRTFARLSDGFNTDTSPRAWSLIGPYGSGKSSFSVFLSQLLSSPLDESTSVAQKVLGKTERSLANKFSKEIKDSHGYLKVLITGAPESMSKRLIKGFAEAADNYWRALPKKTLPKKTHKPKVIKELKDAITTDISTSEVVSLVAKLQEQLEESGCKGILLVIDELGKFLEFEARHYGANDIYLLQALAEHACKGCKVNLFMFVLLHQSFEQYAKGLGENLKNEWSKVQGRFEEVPFLESGEQVLRVVSAAFEYKLKKKQRDTLFDKTTKVLNVLIKQGAIPSALKDAEAVKLYANCYPLHPVSAIILPLLCQKVAQNERTLFSYLGSHEEFGLQHMLAKLDDLDDYIYPHHIYDYFIANQPAALGDYLTHRRWAEVVTAIERLGDASEGEVNILKTIGLLNIIGSKGGFKASKAILETCLSKKLTAQKAIKALQEKSIINYRRFNSEYRVWQGSDFDLEEAIQAETNNIGQFSLAAELNAAKSMLPIVARKYTIQTGALRYFVPIFVDAKSYLKTEKQCSDARIIFYLASDQDDERIFYTDVISHFSDLDVVALSLNGAQLRESVAETLALKRVRTHRQELNSDPVAKREYEDRVTAAEQAENKLLQSLIESPQESVWYHSGEKTEVANKRGMQEMLSGVLNKVYAKTPKIFNELINRDRPSAQANAARNKLLYAMQNHATELDLGIDKFPAEKAIYRAVLRETGLHRLVEDSDGGGSRDSEETWYLCEPHKDGRKDKGNIRHVWQCIDKFLDSTEKQPKSFAALSAKLMAPPYGTKAGILPVFYIAAYLVYQKELAIYEQRRYKPYFTAEMFERFVKRPDEFEFQRFKIHRQYDSILKQYTNLFSTDITLSIPSIFREIASNLINLPNYTLNTSKGLSPLTRKVRDALTLDISPEVILLDTIPKILGYKDLISTLSAHDIKDFGKKISAIFCELNMAFDKLLTSQVIQLSLALQRGHIDDLSLVRNNTIELLEWLSDYTLNLISLRPFITRVMQKNITDTEWVENIFMLLSKKTVKNWSDDDIFFANSELRALASKIIDLEKDKIKKTGGNITENKHTNVYLLGCVKKNGHSYEKIVIINARKHQLIADSVTALRTIINELPEDIDPAAFVATITYDFLEEYNQNKKRLDN